MTPPTGHACNILLLHGGALGDCVLTLQLARAMRVCWDGPRVTVAARSPIARWAARHGLIDASRSLDDLGIHALYGTETPVPDSIAVFLNGFDWIVSFLGGPTETVSRRLLEVPGARVASIDPRPTAETLRDGVHITRQWAADVERQTDSPTIDALEDTARIDAAPALRASLSSRLGCTERPCVLCHPGSGSLNKCCPIDALRLVVQRLQSTGRSVAWMIGPDEQERFGPDFAARLRADAPVIYEESVEAAADLVAGADAFIGNDAGMTHVAALAGVPTLALFGPTDPDVWRPLGAEVMTAGFPVPEISLSGWAKAVATFVRGRE